MKLFSSILASLILLLSACETTAPTPLMIGTLVDKNNEIVSLYTDCSDGANYVTSKEGCNPELLSQKVDETMDLAKIFIGGDIKQPQGYDIYLSTAMIYFRIARRNAEQYSEAEKIARQFFEVQKASSGRSLTAARFYWAAMAAAYSSWQSHYDSLSLDSIRKTDLLLCLAESRIALTDIAGLDGPRRIRLIQYIQVLTAITNSIE